jgi:hypothetical protein
MSKLADFDGVERLFEDEKIVRYAKVLHDVFPVVVRMSSGICLAGKGSDACWFCNEPFRLVHRLGVWSVTEPVATR